VRGCRRLVGPAEGSQSSQGSFVLLRPADARDVGARASSSRRICRLSSRLLTVKWQGLDTRRPSAPTLRKPVRRSRSYTATGSRLRREAISGGLWRGRAREPPEAADYTQLGPFGSLRGETNWLFPRRNGLERHGQDRWLGPRDCDRTCHRPKWSSHDGRAAGERLTAHRTLPPRAGSES